MITLKRVAQAGGVWLSCATFLVAHPAVCGDASAGETPSVQVPGVVIDHQPASSGTYVGSPSIAILPDGDYVASHDIFGPQSGYLRRATTRVFRSSDRGQTWQVLSTIDGQLWSTLFVHRGDLYIMGTLACYNDAIIRRSTNGGKTWTAPKDAKTGLLLTGSSMVTTSWLLHEPRMTMTWAGHTTITMRTT